MVGDNIKKLRETLGLTQKVFAERIGITQSTLSTGESGRSKFSRQALLSISREFGVRLDWLETGNGEMFEQRDSSIIAQLAAKGILTPKGRELIEIFLRMPPHAQDLIYDAVTAAAKLYPRREETVEKPVETPATESESPPEKPAHAVLPDGYIDFDAMRAQIDVGEAAQKKDLAQSSVSSGTVGSSKKILNRA